MVWRAVAVDEFAESDHADAVALQTDLVAVNESLDGSQINDLPGGVVGLPVKLLAIPFGVGGKESYDRLSTSADGANVWGPLNLFFS